MCDRVLLRDLFLKNPQAAPQDLAQEIGRSVSWVKKWRKRLREGDPTDPRRLCSRSRAHHSPIFGFDPRVENPIVDMRLSPAFRIWDALPVLARCCPTCHAIPTRHSAHMPLPRSSRTSLQNPAQVWLYCTRPPRGSRSHKIPETPWKRSKWMATGREECFSSAKSGSRKLKHVIEVCDAGGRRNLCSLVCPGSGRFP
jgi:hypothetical protein